MLTNIFTFKTDSLVARIFFKNSVTLHASPLFLLHAAYNAIWDAEEGSVTRFLQCSGCVSQSSTLSAAVIAADIHHPGDVDQDQVIFINKLENVITAQIQYLLLKCNLEISIVVVS